MDGGGLVIARQWRLPTVELPSSGAVSLCLVLVIATALLLGAGRAGQPGPVPRDGPRPATALPDGLAAAASTSLGASLRRFWPLRRGSSLDVSAGGIDSAFGASGASFGVPGGTVSLSLAGVGREATLERQAAVAPVARVNRVLYRYGSVTQAYSAGPYGIEQSFVVRRRPAGTGPLVIALRVGGSLPARLAGGQVLFDSGAGRAELRYGALSAGDARGRTLPGQIRLGEGILQLRIDDSRARYPLRIDPFVTQGSELKAGEVGAGGLASFGGAVAISADGSTALVTGSETEAAPNGVWAFTRSGERWVQQGPELEGSGQEGESRFGDVMALSADGDTALIGGSGDDHERGAAWYSRGPARPGRSRARS